MLTGANGRRTHAAHYFPVGIIWKIQDHSHFSCQKLQQNGPADNGGFFLEKAVFSIVILHDCNHLKRIIMWGKM